MATKLTLMALPEKKGKGTGKYLAIVILLALPYFAWGQQCSCEQKFQFIKHEIETNYAGYKDKVNPKTKKAYEKLTAETLAKVRREKKEGYCMEEMLEWTKFFNDGHVQLYNPIESNANDTNAINERIKKGEAIYISPQRLQELEHSKDYEEGIYYSFDSSYKIAIIKSKNEFRDYAGVMISSKYNIWKPGEVKLELKKINDSLYTTIMYMRDHSYSLRLFYFDGTSFDGGNWNRVGKIRKPYVAQHDRFEYKAVQLQKLSDSTLYIQIGTFDMSNLKAIDSVFKANESLLKHMPNVVLDLRGNGGGGDAAYEPILPYIYTNPIIGYGNDIYCTQDNVNRMRERAKDPDFPEDMKKWFNELANRMQQNSGKFIVHAGNDTVAFDKTEQYPRKVVILIDKNCASTTEEFLLAAKQSTKVTIMGEHTYGELDYSNWLKAESPCKDIEFHYSSTKSSRINMGKGIDGIGIKPNIELSYDKDWIVVAQKYMEK